MLATIGIFNIFGTTCSGWLTDRLDPRWLLFWYYGLRGLALLGLNAALSDAGLALVVFVVFYGLDWVATVPPTVALCREAFGSERAGVVFAWVFAAPPGRRRVRRLGRRRQPQLVRLVPAGLPVRRLARRDGGGAASSVGRRGLLRPTPTPARPWPPAAPTTSTRPTLCSSDGTYVTNVADESDLPGLMEEGGDEITRRWVNVPIPYTEKDAREGADAADGIVGRPGVAARQHHHGIRGSDGYLGVICFRPGAAAGHHRGGLRLHPAARRRGLVTRRSGWSHPGHFRRWWGAERLEGRTDPENIASQRALSGQVSPARALSGVAVEVGVRKDMICWSLLPSDLT